MSLRPSDWPPDGGGSGASHAPAAQVPAEALCNGSDLTPPSRAAGSRGGAAAKPHAAPGAALDSAAEASSSRGFADCDARAGDAAAGPRAALSIGTAWPTAGGGSDASSSELTLDPGVCGMQDSGSGNARPAAGGLSGAHTDRSACVPGALNGARAQDPPPPWELPAERFAAPAYSVEVDTERRQIHLRQSAPGHRAAAAADASLAAAAPPAPSLARGAAWAGAVAPAASAQPRAGFSRVEPAVSQRASVGLGTGSSNAARQLAALPERPRVFVFDTETTGAPQPRISTVVVRPILLPAHPRPVLRI